MAKSTRKKPILYELFDKLESEAKKGNLNSINQTKTIELNRLINKHLNNFNKQRLRKLINLSNARLKRFFNQYLSGLKPKNKPDELSVFGGYANNNTGVKIQSIKRIKPTLLKEYKKANLESLNLITNKSSDSMNLIKERLWNWIYSNDDPNKLYGTSLRNSVKASDILIKQNKHFRMIIRDQQHKMRGNLDYAIAQELQAISFIWNTRKDKRVVGNPGGLYPKVNNPRIHDNHYERAGKMYFYHNSWAIKGGYINTKAKGFEWADFEDGMPSVPINCRCVASNQFSLISIERFNRDFLTQKGRDWIQSNALY